MNNIINKIAFWFGFIAYGALFIIGLITIKAYEEKYPDIAASHDQPRKQTSLIMHRIFEETEES